MGGMGKLAKGRVLVFLGGIVFCSALPQLLEANDRSTPLLEMAFAAELAGQMAVRDALLDQVLAQDPDNNRARWLAGHVCDEHGWMAVSAAEQKCQDDRQLREYRERREQCGEDAVSRLKLANWCRDHDMPDRERVHLTELVEWHGANPAVLSRLGMVKFQGRWIPKLTRDEIRRLDDQRLRTERKWKPIFAEWRDDLQSKDSEAYGRFSERLRKLDEPECFSILEEMLSTHSEEAALAIVRRLGEMPTPKATESLVRHALFCEFDAGRVAAIESLRGRPKYTYVPMLLGELVAPIEINVELPYGNASYLRRTVTQHGLYQDEKYVDHVMQYAIGVSLRRGQALVSLMPRLPADVRLGRYVVEGDEETTRRNERVCEILYSLTGEAFETSEGWWDWWRNYIENEREDGPPVIERHRYRRTLQVVPAHTSSCLAWGTRIATETGSQPIERIMPGDKVLSQNPDTGQLEHKVVLKRTVQQLEPMLEISFGNESITVTPGHQFWVVGDGWRMAKELTVGQRLHCLTGAQEITGLEERAEAAAFNLVVDDFATYFASESRVLLHDYTFPVPTGAVLPGYVPQ